MLRKHRCFFYSIIASFCCAASLSATDATIEVSRQTIQQVENKYSVLMENMVNVKTPGYREARAASQNERYYNFEQGHFVHTGGKLDFAIEGKGFFAVQSDKNDKFYTRDGRFTVDSEHRLRTYVEGFLVLGEQGPLLLDETLGVISITETGKIVQNNFVIDRLLIADFTDYQELTSINGSYFVIRTGASVYPQYLEDYRLKPGYVEGANINLSKELVEMPVIQRTYDANSKVIQMRLKAMGASLELGKVQ
jgi:flagellar basal-body rod protein FlgF